MTAMYQLRASFSVELTDAVVAVLKSEEVSGITVFPGADAISHGTIVYGNVHDHSVETVVSSLAAIDEAGEIELGLFLVDDSQRYLITSGRAAALQDDSVEGLAMSGASSALRRLVRVDYQYVMVMIAAAIIASAGLVSDLPIAVVGAMAFSPDLGRLNVIAFAAITFESKLMLQGIGSLAVGMAIAIAASTVWTLIGPIFGVDDPLAGIPESLVSFVTEIDLITVTIALAAGVAAMVVFISDRARAAVGVGVSITTIPAAAYAGLALADGQFSEAGDALVVLLVNIVSVVAAGVVTGLVLRSHLKHRADKLHHEAILRSAVITTDG